MPSTSQYTGFAIAVAWPETYCKQPGDWYDNLSLRLGFSKYHYYKVGHAALILIDSEQEEVHYFDFGRYHAPFKHGRVRSELTDYGLKMATKVQISEDGTSLNNLEELLTELQLNPESHGEGTMHASYCRIDFEKAYQATLELQRDSPLPYGPFEYKGTNCSRFVNDAIKAGKPSWKIAFKLNFFMPLTPTPLNNVNAMPNKVVLPKLTKREMFSPTPIAEKEKLKLTLEEPKRPVTLSRAAQWLSGEGAGSWFTVDQQSEGYRISRYSPEGALECDGVFEVTSPTSFNISRPFRVTHLSHCKQVRIAQADKLHHFERLASPPRTSR